MIDYFISIKVALLLILLRSDQKLTLNLMSKYIHETILFFYIYFTSQKIAISTYKPEHVTSTGEIHHPLIQLITMRLRG